MAIITHGHAEHFSSVTFQSALALSGHHIPHPAHKKCYSFGRMNNNTHACSHSLDGTVVRPGNEGGSIFCDSDPADSIAMPQQRGCEGRPVLLFCQQLYERLWQQAGRMLCDQAVARRINSQLQRTPARQVDNSNKNQQSCAWVNTGQFF